METRQLWPAMTPFSSSANAKKVGAAPATQTAAERCCCRVNVSERDVAISGSDSNCDFDNSPLNKDCQQLSLQFHVHVYVYTVADNDF